MIIKYRFMKGTLLKTNCPNRNTFSSGGGEFKFPPKVGSGWCKTECKFFGSIDAEKQEVECKYGEN